MRGGPPARCLPLALAAADRDLLADLAFWAEEGKLLHPRENRAGQKLESMGLCTLQMDRFLVSSLGYYVSKATITAAGRRILRGPELVRLNGRPVEPAASRATVGAARAAEVVAVTPPDGAA